jgi:hypothetical protein
MSLTQPPQRDWYFDTGATSHMASDTGILSSFSPPPAHSPSSIVVGNGNLLPVTATGTTHLPYNFNLNNVLVSLISLKTLFLSVISPLTITVLWNLTLLVALLRIFPHGESSSNVTARDPYTPCSFRHQDSLQQPPPLFGINVLDTLVTKPCLD